MKIKIVLIFNLLMVLTRSIYAENVYTSNPVNVKVVENNSVLLPCYVNEPENHDPLIATWYKNNKMIGRSDYFYPVMGRTYFSNYSMLLSNVQCDDTANYTCEVMYDRERFNAKQTHYVEVLCAPKISTIPPNGYQAVHKGEYVDIGCDVSGTPPITVNWKKNNESLALLDHRNRIKFKAEHRQLSGLYECVATNSVGDPVKASIQVFIHDAPVVSVAQPVVYTAVGLRAALSVTLEYSSPPATCTWYRGGMAVRHTDRVVMMQRNNVYELIFRSVRRTDLGNYTFRAENKLGMADVEMRLTAIAKTASFKVDPLLNKATPTSFTLLWEVDSYSSIIEYNLWIRPYYGRLSTTEPDSFTTEVPKNRWSKIVVPGDPSEGPIHSAKYTVRGLTPSTVYEAIVASRNRFGWSHASPIHHFATEAGDGYQPPSTSEEPNMSPVLEDLEPESYNISQAQVFERIGELSNGVTVTEHNGVVIIFGALFYLYLKISIV